MKKIFILATAAIVALASCTKSEVVYNQGQQEIGFRQFTGSMTKADALSGYASTMGVFAYHNGTTAYITNGSFKESTTTTSIWGGDPTKYYWPLQGNLDFTVYAPHQTSATYVQSTKTLTVPIADNKDDQVDYLYGKKWYGNTKKPETPSNGVAVVLKHALSKVTINVNASDASIFTVSSVKLKSTCQEGKYVVTYAETGDDFSSVVTPKESFTPSDMEFVGTSAWTPATEVGSCTASKLVVPSAQTSIVISYKMAGSTADLTATIDLTTGTPTPAWETGKHYTYNITLKADEILFKPEVEAWVTENLSSNHPIG